MNKNKKSLTELLDHFYRGTEKSKHWLALMGRLVRYFHSTEPLLIQRTKDSDNLFYLLSSTVFEEVCVAFLESDDVLNLR